MLESLESRIKFVILTLKRERAKETVTGRPAPVFLDSAIYQLEDMALSDIAGFRLAHPEVIEHGKD